jgi:uncharacterized membrane protein (UPF0127 family)
MRIPLGVMLIAWLLSSGCHEAAKEKKRTIVVGGIPVKVEVCDTPRERALGLMFRDRLAWDEGMFFVFDEEDTLSFWMRNTYIYLSIAFIDEQGLIVDIKDLEPLDETHRTSDGEARYALEMNRDWFRLNGVEIGDTVVLYVN